LYRWLANRITRTAIPETLVSVSGVRVSQLWPERKIAMEAIAERHLTGPFVALEIGTWFGGGSTAIWASRLTRGSKLFLVDSWREYVSAADKAHATAYAGMDSVHHVAIHSALRRIYEYERGSEGEIFLIRGRACELGAFLRPDSFDFIYIDGSHYYADVIRDVRMAKTLVKDGGVICGDDLELSPTEALVALARRNLDRDFVESQTPDSWFHPGVLLAVSEEFTSVANRAGFWSVMRRGDRWVAA
jgi:predicted O-methyltransferase YrrM